MISIIAKIFICLYWIVLIGWNIYSYSKLDAKKRNWWIKSLIIVNAFVILFTALNIFWG